MTKLPFKLSTAPGKYRAKPTLLDGIRFASKAEATRYAELTILARAGKVFDLELQPKFPLVVNGHKVATYIADFSYRCENGGPLLVEDVKSPATKTAVYKLKKKLVLALHGVEVIEVPRS